MDINAIFGLPDYHLFVVNLILVVFESVGFVIYRFVYPRKQVNAVLLLVLLSVMPIVSFFRKGDFGGGLYMNGAYTASFYQSLQNGVLIPRWAGQLITYYGYPAFIFNYPLPFYLSSLFHWLGFNFINSVKLLLIFSYLLSGITMYLWLREEVSKSSALIGAFLYQFAPYRFVDMHFRLDMGESLAYVFIPLVFLTLIKLDKQPQVKWIVIGAMSTGLLILSHQMLSFTTVCLVGVYCLFLSRKHLISWRSLRNLFPTGLGLGLATYFWLPIFTESKFTHLVGHIGVVEFPSLDVFIFSPWRWGLLYQGPNGEISPALSIAQWGVILGAFILLIFLRKNKFYKYKLNKLRFWLLIFFLIFVLMQGFCAPLWQKIPGLNMFQFSWRLIGVEAFIVGVIASQTIQTLKGKTRWLIISALLLIGTLGTILNWGNRESNPRQFTDRELVTRPNLKKGDWFGEEVLFPIWVQLDKVQGDTENWEPISLISGDAKIRVEKRNTVSHKYQVEVTSLSEIQENTNYFPGWKVIANDKPVLITYQGAKNPGVITFDLLPGKYNVESKFVDTPVRIVGVLISGSVMILLASICLFKKRLDRIITVGIGSKCA